MSPKPVTSAPVAHDREAHLHPLAKQQLDDATERQGTVNVQRLLAAVSACYEASTNLAQDVLSDEQPLSPAVFREKTQPFKPLSLDASALDSLSEGVILLDDKRAVHGLNQVAYTYLGLDSILPRHSFTGKSLTDLFVSLRADTEAEGLSLGAVLDACDVLNDMTLQAVRVADQSHFTLTIKTLDQQGSIIVLRPRDGAPEQARALHLAEQEYSSLFDNAVIGIYRSTLCGKQLRANPALVQLNGYHSEEEQLQGVNDIACEWYVDPARRDVFARELQESGRVTDFVSEIFRHKTRERIWISENAWLVYDRDGSPLFYEGTVVDASDRMAAEEEINHLAHHDHLTSLPNRFMLLKKLREAILRPNMAATIAVHCLDLDHFKDVNDTLGHQAGDKLLVAAGKRLRRSIKAGDILARLGGDEFTILQYGVRSTADVEALASRVVSTMNEPFFISDQQVNVGVSVGVATYKGQEPAGLLRDADVALYESKKAGRRTYSLYTAAMGTALKERRALEDDLRDAVEKGDFDLHLQPIVDAQTGEAVVYEALLRWHHPTRGHVSPARFVPIAEESSLMVGLGDWVLQKTVEAAAYLPPGKRIAMNLSPLQLRNETFVDKVVKAMDAFGIEPDKLEIEITETVIMSDDARTLSALNALRDMGLRLALDDFGTGHASLSYLQRFRFDKIKIDRTFVQRMVDDPISAAVVRAVTSLGSDLGAVVVAEGVETQDQIEALRREGCNLFQGYYYGHPRDWRDVLHPPGYAPKPATV